MKHAPSWLNKVGQDLWKDLKRELEQAGNYNQATATTLAMLCKAYQDYRTLTATIDSEGVIIETRTTKKLHPAITAQKQAYEIYSRLSNDLKLTPKSQQQKQNNLEDELDLFAAKE